MAPKETERSGKPLEGSSVKPSQLGDLRMGVRRLQSLVPRCFFIFRTRHCPDIITVVILCNI